MPDLPPDSLWEIAACSESFTLRERASGQLMHSRIGPWTEAHAVYVAQSATQLGSRDSVVLYDVGMGIAANALAAVAASRAKLRIFSFERYPEALAAALGTPEKFPFHEPYREAMRRLLAEGSFAQPGLKWSLVAGDFRSVELAPLPPADLVYFDFYAPAASPELWDVSMFSKIRKKMAADGLLITYSTTKAVRAALLLAGFFVGEGGATEMKSATTLASPCMEKIRAPLGSDWLKSLGRSTKPLPEGWKTLREHPQFA